MSPSAAPRRARVRRRLPEGTVLLLERDASLPLVGVSIAWRRGCALDPRGKEGTSAMLARVMRAGPRGLASAELEERMARLGAHFGGSVSHSTMRFGGTVLARNLEPFFELLARLVTRPALRRDDIERVRREMLAELVSLQDVDRALGARTLQRALFGRHRYGRPAGGTAHTLRTLSRDDLRARHESLTRRAALVVGFAGDVDAEEAERLVRTHLLPRVPDGPLPPERYGDPRPLEGRHLVFVDKPERTQAQLFVGALGSRIGDPDYHALLVANAAFGGTFTARLMQAIRVERGWSYGAYSSLFRDRRRDQWRMWTAAATEDAPACLRLQIEMLEQWVAEGITPEEHRFAQRFLVRGRAFDLDTAPKRLEERLSDELFGQPENEWARFPEQVEAASLSECNAAVARRIDPRRLAIVVVGTASSLLDAMERLPGLSTCKVLSHTQVG